MRSWRSACWYWIGVLGFGGVSALPARARGWERRVGEVRRGGLSLSLSSRLLAPKRGVQQQDEKDARVVLCVVGLPVLCVWRGLASIGAKREKQKRSACLALPTLSLHLFTPAPRPPLCPHPIHNATTSRHSQARDHYAHVKPPSFAHRFRFHRRCGARCSLSRALCLCLDGRLLLLEHASTRAPKRSLTRTLVPVFRGRRAPTRCASARRAAIQEPSDSSTPPSSQTPVARRPGLAPTAIVDLQEPTRTSIDAVHRARPHLLSLRAPRASAAAAAAA
jgi:hypothetical protein